MKRTILFALMIPQLLTGCGVRRDAENWKAFAETVETAERISFHAEITAHWEDSSASFGADVARAGGETHITLTAPETVSGITIRAKDGEWHLFDFDSEDGFLSIIAFFGVPIGHTKEE